MIMVRTYLTFTALLFCINTVSLCLESIDIHTLYGSATITEPVLIELIQSDAVNRLTKINQYGIMKFVQPNDEYTRYQHSIAVLYLLRHFGAPLEEQVMGLLHDVSHTAFSHVADFLFNTVQDKCSYQDSIFAWYVEHTDLKQILEKYNLLWIYNSDAQETFIMLKDTIPNLCADRLEYNLYGAYLEKLLTKDEIIHILNTLSYYDGKWVFNTVKTAQLFADIALTLSINIWCSDWNCFLYSETAKLLKYACNLELITIDELIFSYDAAIWEKVCTSTDPILQQQKDRILHYNTQYTLGTSDDHDYTTQGKLRWIDPFIQTDTGITRLSSLDENLKNRIEAIKKKFKEPHYIKYISRTSASQAFATPKI